MRVLMYCPSGVTEAAIVLGTILFGGVGSSPTSGTQTMKDINENI